MDIPRRFNWVGAYRIKLHQLTSWLPLPNINPSIFTFLSLVASVGFAFIWSRQPGWAAVLLAVSLLLDWLDGAIAEHFHRASAKGWWIDAIEDRLSEIIILGPFAIIWTYLFALNASLTFVSYKIRVNVTMPLRFTFFFYFLFFGAAL